MNITTTKGKTMIENVGELSTVPRGTVLKSPRYLDAMSVVSAMEYRDGNSYGTMLMNVATGHKTSLAQVPDFLPADAVFTPEYSKG